MPADRRITVHVEQPGDRNEFGEYQAGPSLDLLKWATRDDLSLSDVESQGGTYASITRRWRIRWDSRIYHSVLSEMTITEDTLLFNALSITEITDQGASRPRSRRRWLDLTGVYTP